MAERCQLYKCALISISDCATRSCSTQIWMCDKYETRPKFESTGMNYIFCVQRGSMYRCAKMGKSNVQSVVSGVVGRRNSFWVMKLHNIAMQYPWSSGKILFVIGYGWIPWLGFLKLPLNEEGIALQKNAMHCSVIFNCNTTHSSFWRQHTAFALWTIFKRCSVEWNSSVECSWEQEQEEQREEEEEK